MRQNLPVTQREHRLSAETTLVSITDLKGRIVYANAAFAEASGYAREELMGQPHNLVRHPDVPAEAFRDLWATLEKGHPWQLVVKNRRKNGDHYWVLAHAIPVRADGAVVGYMSVRTVPTADQVREAEALYVRLHADGPDGRGRIALKDGAVVRRDLWGRGLAGGRAAVGSVGWSGLACGIAAGAIAGVSAWLPLQWAVPVSVVAASAGLSLVRRIEAAPLRRVLKDAQQMAAGDLMLAVRGRHGEGLAGELEQTLMQLGVCLRSVLDDVRVEALSVRGAVDEIAAGNQELASRTESQASSLEQTAAAAEQIHGTVQQSTASAQEGARLAAQAATAAQRSHQSVLGVVQAMEAINDSSRRIGEILGVIEGVAFQTNILALNAAVEAARAGEQGRGFAVVAGEVRALAHRTTDAAREIKSLITESGERVAAGRTQTAEARDRMHDALEVVHEVSRLLDEIGTASSEQQIGVGQVNEAVASLDSITQQNATMVEELSASAHSLVQQVQEVQYTMSVLRLQVGDKSPAQTDAVALRRDQEARAAAAASRPFRLQDAVAAHVNWKTRLRNAALRGTVMDAEQIARDDCCPLGRWLHGGGRGQWGHRPQFSALVDRHAEFHREASSVARLVNAQRQSEALSQLGAGTPFSRATQATLLAIRTLQNDIDNDAQGQASAAVSAEAAELSRVVIARAQTPAVRRTSESTPEPALSQGADDGWDTF